MKMMIRYACVYLQGSMQIVQQTIAEPCRVDWRMIHPAASAYLILCASEIISQL